MLGRRKGKVRTSSTLQMMVPSGISPTGFTLPIVSVDFFPQYTNCRGRRAGARHSSLLADLAVLCASGMQGGRGKRTWPEYMPSAAMKSSFFLPYLSVLLKVTCGAALRCLSDLMD